MKLHYMLCVFREDETAEIPTPVSDVNPLIPLVPLFIRCITLVERS